MTNLFYIDTETCGLHGMPVLLQYAEGDGDIVLWELWKEPIIESLLLIERIADRGIIGFNLAFDWFHLYKFWSTCQLIVDKDQCPADIIDDMAIAEEKARDIPFCLKPRHAFDIMLHARKGEYQTFMDRKEVRVKRIPRALAPKLAMELERRIHLKDAYFARNKQKSQNRWQIVDILDEDEVVISDFVDVVLKFAPSSALKALALDALNLQEDTVIKFADVELDVNKRPAECGYAPFALAGVVDARGDVLPTGPGNWRLTWPDMIPFHIDHWRYNTYARQYAQNDIIYTRGLYKYFGEPPVDDVDSILATMVAVNRWRGYAINPDALRQLKIDAAAKITGIPQAAKQVRAWLGQVMSPAEQLAIKGSTKKIILEEVAKWTIEDEEKNEKTIHPAAVRAKAVLGARTATEHMEIYDKLLQAGRFHASFVVIGTLSTRMAGTDDLNAQGIPKQEKIRTAFPLAHSDMQLSGGDFSSFEVTLAEAVFKDDQLRKELLQCGDCKVEMHRIGSPVLVKDHLSESAYGKYVARRIKEEVRLIKKDPCYVSKTNFCDEIYERTLCCPSCGITEGRSMHGIFGSLIYEDMDYDAIMGTKGTVEDLYTRSKSGFFALIYGGTEYTLQTRLGVSAEMADAGYQAFINKYTGVKAAREGIFNKFCSMRQPKGLGTKVEWHTPADYVESFLGFRRYFTLENAICKTLFEIGTNPPGDWKHLKFKVVRRDRQQTAFGATQSACFGAAFAIQASNMRAANNHLIQSPGAQITKTLQSEIWKLQPIGVSKWTVTPLNVHDEIMCPTAPHLVDQVKIIVDNYVESLRGLVPLIKMDWAKLLGSWGEK